MDVRQRADRDFGWGELSLRVRLGTIEHEEGQAIVLDAAAFTAEWSNNLIESIDIVAATAFVARFDLKLRLPDAIHIAVAQRIGATLVTSDLRQAEAAAVFDIPIFNPLAGVAS